MSKFTRNHKKKIRKNRTIKIGGYKNLQENNDIRLAQYGSGERKGIIDKLGENISNVTSSATDVGLKLLGLQVIDKDKQQDKSQIDTSSVVQGKTSDIDSEEKSSLLSTLKTGADKTGASILNDINDVLASDQVQGTTEQAAQDTADILKIGAKKFNDALSNPEVKEEISKAIKNAGDLGSVFIEAGEEPFNKAVDVATNAAQKASSAALSGAIKVGTDALAAVPFFGAVVDAGKMVNDFSKAASAVNEAGTEAIEEASDAFLETTKNFKNKLRELDEKKKMAQKISDRTAESINEFENPTVISENKVGGKTKRKFLKRKYKSKRVRFAI